MCIIAIFESKNLYLDGASYLVLFHQYFGLCIFQQ